MLNLKFSSGLYNKDSVHLSTNFLVLLQVTPPGPLVSKMWRQKDTEEGNHQLLTLVHGVDRKGRPVIKAYFGNSRHPVYQEYQHAINKECQKAARLAASSRATFPPRGADSSCFDYYPERFSESLPSTRVSIRTTVNVTGARAPMMPDLRDMRFKISRLRCSLALHTGLGDTGKELSFLPLIPIRVKKQPSTDFPKKGRTKTQPSSSKQNSAGKMNSDNGVTQPASSKTNEKGYCTGCKAWTNSKTKKKTN